MDGIEKAVIRPTYAEWVDIYSEDKLINFIRRDSMVAAKADSFKIKPLAIYQRAIEENIEITKKNMPDLITPRTFTSDLDPTDMLRLKGFNTMNQAKKYIAVMKNPNTSNIEVYIDAEEDIVKLNFDLDAPEAPVDNEKYIFSPNKLGYVRGGLTVGDEKVTFMSAETTRVKLFDFENSKRVDVYFAEEKEAGYDPINDEYSETQTDDFLPSVKILGEHRGTTTDMGFVKTLLKANNVYFIPHVNGKRPKALNKLVSGKSLISSNYSRFLPDVDGVKTTRTGVANYVDNPSLNVVLPQLEPLPNEYKKYEEKLNEVFEPKSTKKIIKRMQYLTRLEARKSREGRGVGKYTGDRDFDENRPKLYFYHSLIPNGVYSPQTKKYEPINLLAFYIERGGRMEPADDMMLFVNEAFVPSYFAESDRNKDWARISWNVAKDSVEGLISYAKDLQVRYRSRKKIDLDNMSEKMKNAFESNLKEIMENSFFSYMSFDKRRGKRLKVRKSNMLKSATEIKNTFETILRKNHGPFKQFKELDKSELGNFIDNMNNQEKKIYDFEDTRFNIQFNFIPVSEDKINEYMSNATGLDSEITGKLINRAKALDGDYKQYFGIKNITVTNESDHIGMLVICYFFNGDEMDRIEAVSLTAQRVEYRPRIIQQASKDVSLEYPADEIGVFMYEIMTGMRRVYPLMLGRSGGNPSTTPSKLGASFMQGWKDREFKFADFLIDNMKYNEIRNEFVGFIVGQSPSNKMFSFLFTDSTLRGATSANMVCLGKMDLFYSLDGGVFKGEDLGSFSRSNSLYSEDMTFEDFKRRVSIGLNATESGSCLHFAKGINKGDQLGTFAATTFLTGNPKDFLAGKFTEDVKRGMLPHGQQVERPKKRIKLHYELYKRYGTEFEEFIKDKVRKAVESGEIKLGSKYVKQGSVSGDNFNPTKPNHAIIYTPPKTEEPDEEITKLREAENVQSLLTVIFRDVNQRLPTASEMEEFSDILGESNTMLEIRDKMVQIGNRGE